jgi:hypothetical protein
MIEESGAPIFGKIRDLTDVFHNLFNRVDCRLLAAQLVGDIRFDLLHIDFSAFYS